jgi:hypothetical protein
MRAPRSRYARRPCGMLREGERRGPREERAGQAAGVRVLVVSGPCVEGGVSVSWVSPRPVPGDGLPRTTGYPGNPFMGAGERAGHKSAEMLSPAVERAITATKITDCFVNNYPNMQGDAS